MTTLREFRHEIDGIYPEGKPFSTMPGTVLATLPALPDAIDDRFLGRHRILFDVRAGVILDRIPFAIRRPERDEDSSRHGETDHRD